MLCDVDFLLTGPPSNSSVLDTSIDMAKTAFVFMNFQLARLELLSEDLAEGILIAAEDLRHALDRRRVRPEVVHVVSLHQPIEFPAPMTPREGELVIAKQGMSAFYQTGLSRHLVDKGVDRVFVCGISTLGEAGATALAALDIFGRARVVEDAYVETDNECYNATTDLLAALDMLTDINSIESLRDEEPLTGPHSDEGPGGEDKETMLLRRVKQFVRTSERAQQSRPSATTLGGSPA